MNFVNSTTINYRTCVVFNIQLSNSCIIIKHLNLVCKLFNMPFESSLLFVVRFMAKAISQLKTLTTDQKAIHIIATNLIGYFLNFRLSSDNIGRNSWREIHIWIYYCYLRLGLDTSNLIRKPNKSNHYSCR